MHEKQYEERFNLLLERGSRLHASNKKRIRIGLILLSVFTVGMILIRLITESDRATFLIIWVIGMFAISIYLIGIEYIDDSLARTLKEVTERDTGWDELIPDSETARGMVQEKIDDRRVEMRDRLDERRSELQELLNLNQEAAEPESEDEK